MQSDLIDRIYECAVVPELWPSVLDDLARMTDCRGGLLFSARKALCWTASDSVRDVFEDYVNDGWFMRCPRRPCLMSQAAPAFFVEQDFWSEEEIGADPIYRDFFRPRGLGWSAGTGLQLPTGDSIVFSVERTLDRGPVEPDHVSTLNALRPHLARSALVSARLSLPSAYPRGAIKVSTSWSPRPSPSLDRAANSSGSYSSIGGIGATTDTATGTDNIDPGQHSWCCSIHRNANLTRTPWASMPRRTECA